jgi:hypothetical protein
MSSSVGMMTFPTEWKIKNVPNHQPGKIFQQTIFDDQTVTLWCGFHCFPLSFRKSKVIRILNVDSGFKQPFVLQHVRDSRCYVCVYIYIIVLL